MSPFVAFVKELQSTFDETLRRHTNDDALCSEINKARRQFRDAAIKELKNQ